MDVGLACGTGTPATDKDINSMVSIESMSLMATTVSLDEETKDMLQRLGRKGETYDDVIRRLIKEAGWTQLDDRWNEILESDEFIPLDEL